MCISLQLPLSVIDEMTLYDFNGIARTMDEIASDIKSSTGGYTRKRYPHKISGKGLTQINQLKNRKKKRKKI